MKIVVDYVTEEEAKTELSLLPKDAEIVCKPLSDPEDIVATCADADAILSWPVHYTREILEKLPKLKMICNCSMGVDNIDLEAAKDLGIAVANVPDYCYEEVSEHAATLILALLRNVVGYNRDTHNGIWDPTKTYDIYRMNTLTMGFFGFGRIPRMVAGKLSGFKMKYIAYDPFLPKEVAEEAGATLVSKQELAEQADAVLAHVPMLNESTRDTVDREFFMGLKKKPVFVSTARGATVDQEAMLDAVEAGLIKAAACDVLKQEPPAPDDRIWKYDNVILTPHAAYNSITSDYEVYVRSCQSIEKFLKGEVDDPGINFVVKPSPEQIAERMAK